LPAIRPVGHEDRLSLVEHLDELRTRLIFSIVAFVAAFSLCYWQNHRILDVVNRPLERAHRIDCKDRGKARDVLERSGCFDQAVGDYLKRAAPVLNRAAAQASGASAQELRALAASAQRAAALTPRATTGRQPVTLGVTEPFLTTVTVSAYAALLLSLPFILWQAYAFVLPAFTREERRAAVPMMLLVPLLFAAGVAFGYFIALPRAVTFLQNYNDGAFDILVQARDYYRFTALMLVGMGLMFQVPVGVLAIVRLRVLTTRQLRAFRGYALILFAIIAAVVTPTPDPFTMLITMAPLVLLYELSILLARAFEPKGDARWAFDAADDDRDELD
jgi:sec-independent protein translocase protein TatC